MKFVGYFWNSNLPKGLFSLRLLHRLENHRKSFQKHISLIFDIHSLFTQFIHES